MAIRAQQSIPPRPDNAAHVARDASRAGNPCLLPRDQSGSLFKGIDLADLRFSRGRRAAEAVRTKIGRTGRPGLAPVGAGFEHGVLCGCRGRLLGGASTGIEGSASGAA